MFFLNGPLKKETNKQTNKKLQFCIEFPEMNKAETESKNLQLELPWEYLGTWRYFRGFFFFSLPIVFWNDKMWRSSEVNDNDVRKP